MRQQLCEEVRRQLLLQIRISLGWIKIELLAEAWEALVGNQQRNFPNVKQIFVGFLLGHQLLHLKSLESLWYFGESEEFQKRDARNTIKNT